MISANSRVRINRSAIQCLTRAQITALEQTSDALLTEVKLSQVMPFNTGNLQNESTFVDYSKSSQGKCTIVSTTPYARRLYYHPEYNFRTTNNAYAQAHWYDDWIDGNNKDFCKNAYADLYRRLTGV